MVQNYYREEKRIWEDFRHGLILSSQKFVDRIKSKYLKKIKSLIKMEPITFLIFNYNIY